MIWSRKDGQIHPMQSYKKFGIMFRQRTIISIGVRCQMKCEYSCAVTPQVRQTGNRLSGLAGTAYASLLA